MKKLLFAIVFILPFFFLSPTKIEAQATYKCAFDSSSNCHPCTSFNDMGGCQSSFLDNVCGNNLNPCVGFGACAERGSDLTAQAVQTCPAAPVPGFCNLPNTCVPDGATCAENASGGCSGNRTCCKPAGGAPPPTQINCADLGGDWDCRPLTEVIAGNYDCSAGGNTDPNSNPYHMYCGGNVDSGYKCCQKSLGASAPFAPPAAVAPFLCDPGTGNAGEGVRTGLGCLNITGTKTIETVLNWAIGLSGGIAFVLIIVAAFQITTAAGDAKRVKAGQELVTSAIAGLVLIALSAVLLNFIGVNVLGLQGLGFSTP